MRISICTQLFNPLGDLLLDASEDSDFTYLSRRLTRTATLDGGSVIVDNGYSPSDGTIKIMLDPANSSPAIYLRLATVIQLFGMVTVASREGVFLAAIQNITNQNTNMVINLLIKSKLI